MGDPLKVVLDTNVLVSGLIGGRQGNPHQIYLAFKKQKFTLVTSVEILDEVEDVINRNYIVDKYRITASERQKMMKILVDLSFVVSGLSKAKVVKDDPKDDKFIVAAQNSQASDIVSGDPHLLKIKIYQGTKIITPRKFVKVLKDIK